MDPGFAEMSGEKSIMVTFEVSFLVLERKIIHLLFSVFWLTCKLHRTFSFSKGNTGKISNLNVFFKQLYEI